MSTFLFAWELGAGLGHLVPIRRLGERLISRGHRVVAAVRNLVGAETVFSGCEIEALQAPVALRGVRHPFKPPSTFAHILYNEAFGNSEDLAYRANAWRTLFRLARPDVVVCDHSPTALLAAHGDEIPRIVLGIGFYCPTDEQPMRDLRPWQTKPPERLATDEQRVLELVNKQLATWDAFPLDQLSQLYFGADDTVLITFPELDHFGQRDGMPYWGVWPWRDGASPCWNAAGRKRIYAYLKPDPNLPMLLDLLCRIG